MGGFASMRFYVAAFILLAFAVGLSAQGSNSVDARRAQLRDALQAEWEYTLRTQPEVATYVGDTRYNDRLGDYSAEAIAKDLEHNKQQLKLFEAIDTTGFPDDEALNQQLMVRGLRENIEGAQFNDWQMPVNQFKDYENYIARLHQIPRALEQITANMKLGMANQLMPPKYLLQKVAAQAQNIADSTEAKSPFTDPLT